MTNKTYFTMIDNLKSIMEKCYNDIDFPSRVILNMVVQELEFLSERIEELKKE